MAGSTLRLYHPRLSGFRANRLYEAVATVEDVQEDLALLEAFRRRIFRRDSLYKWLAIAILLGGGGLGLMLTSEVDEVGVIVAVVSVVIAAALWVTRRLQAFMETRRLQLARLMVHELDIAPGSKVELRLDLAPIEIRRKKTGKEHGHSVYEDPFFELFAQLADGGQIRLSRGVRRKARTVHQHRAMTFETHDVYVDVIDLELPAVMQMPADGSARLKVPDGMKVAKLAAQGSHFRVELASGRKWESHANVSREGLLDVPSALASLIGQAYSFAGLEEPLREDSPEWPSVRLPVLGVPAIAVLLMIIGIPVLLVGVIAVLDDQDIAAGLLGAGGLSVALGWLLRSNFRKRAEAGSKDG